MLLWHGYVDRSYALLLGMSSAKHTQPAGSTGTPHLSKGERLKCQSGFLVLGPIKTSFPVGFGVCALGWEL